MRIQRQSNKSDELINISSLIDVMFILIIFFLATTTFMMKERDEKVSLPDSAEGQALSKETSVIVINVREDGTYLLGADVMELEELHARLVEKVKEKEGQKVLVRGDEMARHGMVAAAILTCKRSGIHEANIGYDIPK